MVANFDFSSHYFEKNWGTCVHFSVKCVFQQKIATFQNQQLEIHDLDFPYTGCRHNLFTPCPSLG
jgi:hypothetical protein